MHARYTGLTHVQTYTQNMRKAPGSHGGPLWFNCGGHFDFRPISSCHILILHRALGSLNMKTYVWIPKAYFCVNWFESY